MAIIVQKYGGSSVGDVEKLKAVAQRVVATRNLGYDVVVVVSAMSGDTDRLLGMARNISKSPRTRELDMLLSTGERISMSLLSLAIQELGVDAISFTGSQSGIMTNDSHADARIIDVRPVRVLDELARGRVVIIAGYQGMSYKREVTTLGRGGSDTTAVAMAAALGAEVCEICSDVEYVYTSDPRKLSGVQPIAELSYEEALALTESGAKVLNPEAVSYAMKNGVTIFSTSTFGTTGSGTYILGKRSKSAPGSVTGVAMRAFVHLLRFEGPAAVADDILQMLQRHGLPLYTMELRETGENQVQLKGYIPPEDAHGWESFAEACTGLHHQGIRVSSDTGSVTLVGEGITDRLDTVREVWTCLRDAGYAPCDLMSGAHRITALLPRQMVQKAAQLLHDRFINATNRLDV